MCWLRADIPSQSFHFWFGWLSAAGFVWLSAWWLSACWLRAGIPSLLGGDVEAAPHTLIFTLNGDDPLTYFVADPLS